MQRNTSFAAARNVGGSGATWIMIDASHHADVVIAAAEPSTTPRISTTRSYPVATLPTFTDSLLRFERETGITLNGAACVLTTAGVVNGSSIAIARSRWTISRDGLSVLFGQPVTVINDGAARAWAALAGVTATQALRGTAAPTFGMTGRRMLVIIDEGVGAAIIDIDAAGNARVLETEAGHMGFAPIDEEDDRLLAAMRRDGGATSWERALMLSPEDPIWTIALPGSSHTDRVRRHARLAGSFVGDLTLAYGSWQGALLVGKRAPHGRDVNAAFDAGFIAKRAFRRQLLDTPCWRLEQHDYVLRGAASLLARRHAEQPAPHGGFARL